jgi:hypothetical protein
LLAFCPNGNNDFNPGGWPWPIKNPPTIPSRGL